MARANLVSEISFFVSNLNAKKGENTSHVSTQGTHDNASRAGSTGAFLRCSATSEVDYAVLRYVMSDTSATKLSSSAQNPSSGRMRPLSSPSKMQNGDGNISTRPRTASTRNGQEAPVRECMQPLGLKTSYWTQACQQDAMDAFACSLIVYCFSPSPSHFP